MQIPSRSQWLTPSSGVMKVQESKAPGSSEESQVSQESGFTSTESSEDPTLRFRLATRNFALGSAPGLGMLAHVAGAFSCSKGTCGPVKEHANSLGFLANAAGTVALGAALIVGGGPTIGAATAVLLGASGLACAFVQDQGR